MSKKFPRCIVGSETARMLKLGHPWVVADRFTSRWPQLECGSLVELRTEQGEPLGVALVDPGSRIVARRLTSKLTSIGKD